MVLVSDNNSLLTRSQQIKNVQISGFAQYDKNNLFSSNPKDENKFSIYCYADKYENNISILKRQAAKILNEISASDDDEIIIDSILKDIIIKPILNNLTCYFSGDELIREDGFYKNKYTAINLFDIDYETTTLQYDRDQDVFQLVIVDFTIYSEELRENNMDIDQIITVNITTPGASLSKIKNK